MNVMSNFKIEKIIGYYKRLIKGNGWCQIRLLKIIGNV